MGEGEYGREGPVTDEDLKQWPDIIPHKVNPKTLVWCTRTKRAISRGSKKYVLEHFDSPRYLTALKRDLEIKAKKLRKAEEREKRRKRWAEKMKKEGKEVAEEAMEESSGDSESDTTPS